MRSRVYLFMLTAGLCGCSVNSFGPAFAVHTETRYLPGARLVTIRASGLHVYTHEGFGAQLGTSVRQHLYPLVSANPDTCLVQAFATESASEESDPVHYGDVPVVSALRSSGLGFEFGNAAFTANLGARTRILTRIDPALDTVVWYQHDPAAPLSRPCATISRTTTTTNTRGHLE